MEFLRNILKRKPEAPAPQKVIDPNRGPLDLAKNALGGAGIVESDIDGDTPKVPAQPRSKAGEISASSDMVQNVQDIMHDRGGRRPSGKRKR